MLESIAVPTNDTLCTKLCKVPPKGSGHAFEVVFSSRQVNDLDTTSRGGHRGKSELPAPFVHRTNKIPTRWVRFVQFTIALDIRIGVRDIKSKLPVTAFSLALSDCTLQESPVKTAGFDHLYRSIIQKLDHLRFLRLFPIIEKRLSLF